MEQKIGAIEIGYQVYLQEGGEEFGAVREVAPAGRKEIVVYVENAGDFVVPLFAVNSVHEQSRAQRRAARRASPRSDRARARSRRAWQIDPRAKWRPAHARTWRPASRRPGGATRRRGRAYHDAGDKIPNPLAQSK